MLLKSTGISEATLFSWPHPSHSWHNTKSPKKTKTKMWERIAPSAVAHWFQKVAAI
jgi:hypothetical protein